MPAARSTLDRIAHLRVDRARANPAPHKPLLLLVVLELAETGELPDHLLPLSPELAFRFCMFWTIVQHRRPQKPDVRFPFFHMASEGLWMPVDGAGQPAVDHRFARAALLDPEFVQFARDAALREQARRILIAKYFEPAERIALYTLLGMRIPKDEEIAADASFEATDSAKVKGRDTRFRLDVVAAYSYTCALTGLRLTTITAGSIVDAAHIHQFSDSRNDDPRNGMALCKNAHWLFDAGLWSLDDGYRVLVLRERFDEQAPDQKPLASYEGQRIRLPSDERIWPDARHLAWHRKKHAFKPRVDPDV
ncbi:MAG TPA: HNH endonuclease [Pirellulales bacterium]|nr:HNH endonuclease [Pirellulales bacterium]